MQKFRLLGIVTVLMATAFVLNACAAKPSPEASCNFVQNSDQQRVSWGSQVPVVLYIDSSVPSEYFDDIKTAAETWNTNIGREVIKIGGYVDTKGGEPAQDGQNIIYYMPTWEPGQTNEQARTTVYWAGDRIYEADVRINAARDLSTGQRYFNFSSGDSLETNDVDMQSLILHEFGHVLGLAHTLAPQSVMVKSLPSIVGSESLASNDGIRRKLAPSDEDSIRCEY